jgi:hypothetical protein
MPIRTRRSIRASTRSAERAAMTVTRAMRSGPAVEVPAAIAALRPEAVAPRREPAAPAAPPPTAETVREETLVAEDLPGAAEQREAEIQEEGARQAQCHPTDRAEAPAPVDRPAAAAPQDHQGAEARVPVDHQEPQAPAELRAMTAMQARAAPAARAVQ